MSSGSVAPLSEEELRSALENAKSAGDLAAVRSILNQPRASTCRVNAASELKNAALRGISIAAKEGDVHKINSIFQEWRADKTIPPVEDDEFHLGLVLRQAIEKGRKDIVITLLENGVGVDSITVETLGGTGRHGPDPDTLRDILDELLAHGWDINMKSENEDPPITFAYADPVFLEWLLQHKADPNVSDSESDTPVSLVAQHSSAAMLETLFEHGAAMDNNALHAAVRRSRDDTDRISILECLLDHEADINALETNLELKPTSNASKRAPTATTPLFTAVANEDIEMVRFLLARGADKENRNMTYQGPGSSPVTWASVREPRWSIRPKPRRTLIDPELRELLTGSKYPHIQKRRIKRDITRHDMKEYGLKIAKQSD